MLVTYLDDSDAETAEALTIAGYVADEEGWKVFESQAEKVCQDFNVDVLHCREFDYRKGCFKGWTVPRQIDFLTQMGDAMLAADVLFGISRSIPKDLYKRQKKEVNLDHSTSAYGQAFAAVVHAVRHDEPYGVTERVKNEGVIYRVEAGHKNNADLERHIEEQIKNDHLHKDTRVEIVEKTSCRAIQMADLYAFFSRRRANKWAINRGKIKFFPDALQLYVENRLPHYTGYIEQPYREATVESSGMKFQVKNWVTAI